MTTDHRPRASAREWIALAVLTLPAMIVVMDLTVLHLAVPHLSADLMPSASQLLWITDIYGFVIAGFLIPMGSLGDRIGRRRLLLIGAAGFGVASVLSAYATSPEMLIAARALMGFAGATLKPSTLSLIRNMFHDDRQRTLAVSLWMMSFMVGASVGPLVGGALLEVFWWGSVFLVGVPVMVLLLVAGPVLLPEFRDPNAGRLDMLSSVLLLAAVLPMVYGIKKTVENGVGWPLVVAVVVGVGSGVLFVRRQRTLRHPLLDLTLFRKRSYGVTIGVVTTASFVMIGLNLFIMQYLQLVHGLSPFRAGLWVLPITGAMVVGLVVGPLVAARVRPGFVMAGGLFVAAAGIAIMTQVDGSSGFTALIVGGSVMAAGLAPPAALGTDLIVRSAPPEKAGAASAVSATSNELAGALGLALLGSIGTAVYRSNMGDSLVAGANSAAAGDSLAATAAVAATLPADLGASLLTAARAAFTDGLQVTALVCTAVVLVVVPLAAVLLRDVGSPATSDKPGGEPATAVTGSATTPV
jgi:DHA2 family multidrug resistance protein-like MFS transporter